MHNIIKIVLISILYFPISIFAIDFYSSSQTILPASNGHSTASKINQTVKFLADQLSQNKDFANISDSSIAITSFVNVENLKETSKLGNLISEHLIHDMQIRGYRIIDFKAMPDIEVGAHGDYAFSRSVKNLKQDISLSYILTGTYTYYADGVSLNARIIDTRTNVVASTAQAFIPKADLQYIVDSLVPFDSMGNRGGDMNNMMSNSMLNIDYIVPGVEGNRVKLKKANW
jgi:TolB-like protein